MQFSWCFCLVVVYQAECLVCGLIVLLPLASPPQWCWQRDTINISNVVYQPSVNSNYHRQTPPSTQNILHTESCAAATASKCVCYNLLWQTRLFTRLLSSDITPPYHNISLERKGFFQQSQLMVSTEEYQVAKLEDWRCFLSFLTDRYRPCDCSLSHQRVSSVSGFLPSRGVWS